MRSKVALSLLVLVCLSIMHCSDHPTAPERDRATEPTNPEARQFGEASVPTEKQVVHADNDFGFRLFRELANAKPDSNVVISPLSVSIALGMTVNGAAGSTLEDMKATLGLSGYSMEYVNRCYRSLIHKLKSLDPEVQFDIANSLWCREGIPFKKPFLDACEEYFDAQATNLDFSRPDAASTINGWVADRTHDKITQIVSDPINPLTMIILINAIYFNGAWKIPFDPERTYDGKFRLPDWSWTNCRMMEQPETCDVYTCLSTAKFDAIDMAYGDSIFSMTVFLPKEGFTIASMLEDFDRTNWEVWMGGFGRYCGRVVFPRFEIEYGIKMNDVLRALGMGIIFDPGRADFSRMCTYFNDFYVQNVKHKTYIRVDERGTEAAAVTSVEMGPTSVPPIYVVNRPFVFVIRENQSNTILFLGQITDPGYFTD
jgi:serine protease inhibitor